MHRSTCRERRRLCAFKFVHNTPIVPVFTRTSPNRCRTWTSPSLRRRRSPGDRRCQERCRGHQRRTRYRVTKSWGMVDNRTSPRSPPSTSTPPTSASWPHRPDTGRTRARRGKARVRREIIRQFSQTSISGRTSLFGSARTVVIRIRRLTAIRKWSCSSIRRPWRQRRDLQARLPTEGLSINGSTVRCFKWRRETSARK